MRVLFTFNPYNFNKVDRDVLGKLYEKYLDREERKRLGEFYTPEEVIDYILDSVDYTRESVIEGKKLLDPACGSGGFLVRATNIFVEKLKNSGFDAETILRKLQESIYGFDINSFACHLAETNLFFQVVDIVHKAKENNPDFVMDRFNIYQTDSLRIPEEKGELELFPGEIAEYLIDAEVVKRIKLKQDEFKDGFDFVVGNPPYVDVRKITDEEVVYLMKVYKSASNRINTYGLFIERSICLLKLKGKLGFITSNTYLTSTSYNLLRKIILDTCKIDEILELRGGVFKEATVETVVTILSLENNDEYRGKNKIKIAQVPFTGEIKRLTTSYIDQKLFNETTDNMFNIYLSGVHNMLISKIRTGCKKLLEVADSYNGINPGNALKNLISNYKKDERYKKVIDGKNVDRYSINYHGQYILYDKKILERSRDERIFLGEKLIFQKIGKHIIGSYDNEQYYTLINTSIILSKLENFSLKYLLALLNSKLMDYYYTKVFIGVQIKNAFLNQLPIKPASAKVQQEFANLVDQILGINKDIPTLEAKVSDIQKLLEDFDFILGDLADIPGIRVELRDRIGKPRIKREELKVYLDHKSYIDCKDENQANYIDLYLKSLGDTLRGKTDSEVVDLIRIPKSPAQLQNILQKRQELLNQIEELKHRQDEIDKEIDEKVYKLYGLTPEEIEIVENKSK